MGRILTLALLGPLAFWTWDGVQAAQTLPEGLGAASFLPSDATTRVLFKQRLRTRSLSRLWTRFFPSSILAQTSLPPERLLPHLTHSSGSFFFFFFNVDLYLFIHLAVPSLSCGILLQDF